MSKEEGVEGRVAVVTGSARGIGKAICAALAERGAGVAVCDLLTDAAEETAAELRERGARAVAVGLDVTDSASVARAAETVASGLGQPDVLVNNAGWDEMKPFVETDEDFWRRIVEINYLGALRVTRALLPAMLERGWGRVVSTSSDAARVGSSMEAVYAGAKAGLVGFSKSLARETARKGVTVNVVCPGPTETPLLEGMAAAQQDAAKVLDAMTRAVPMRRLGRPEDVAAAAAFLCSEEAAFITGQTLSVSGGLTMA